MHVTPGMQPGRFPEATDGILKKKILGGRQIWSDPTWGERPQLSEASFDVNNDGALLELMEAAEDRKEMGVLLLLRAPQGVIYGVVQLHQMSGTSCFYTKPGFKASHKARTAGGYQDTEHGRAEKAEIISVTSQDQEGFDITGTPGVRRLMSWQESGEQLALYHIKCFSAHYMWRLTPDGKGVWADCVGRNLPLRIQRKVDGQLTSPVYFYLSEGGQIVIGRPPAKERSRTQAHSNVEGKVVATVATTSPGLEDLLQPTLEGRGADPVLDDLVRPANF